MSELDEPTLTDPATSLGNVYLFNVTTRSTTAPVLNGTAISSLAAVMQSSNYQPTSVKKVPRIDAGTTDIAKFADSNTLTIRLTGGLIYGYTVNIPSATYPYPNDVLLYVLDAYLVVSDTNGDNLQFLPGIPQPSDSDGSDVSSGSDT